MMKKNILVAVVIGLVVSILVTILAETHLVNNWEMKTYDLRMTMMRSNQPKPEDVVLFYIDEASLRFMDGQGVGWPWPRELYAGALDFCKQGGAKAVVFDFFYSEASVYGVDDDAAFAKGVANGPPTYFVTFLSKNPSDGDSRADIVISKSYIPFDKSASIQLTEKLSFNSLPIEPLVQAATGFGNAEAVPDDDGVFRRIKLVEGFNGFAIPALSLKVASDLKKPEWISWPKKTEFRFGDEKIGLDSNGEMLINYYGGVGTFQTYPLGAVLVAAQAMKEGKEIDIKPAIVKDKVVVIGPLAPGLYDMKSSPFSRVYPGSEVHATVIQNLLRDDHITSMNKASCILLSFVIALLTAVALVHISSSIGVGVLVFGFFAAITGASFFLFKYSYYMPLIQLIGALAGTSFVMFFYKYLTEGRKKREIRRAFGQYLSPDVVAEISKDPSALKLGGELTDITVFFSDIQGFTSISEKMDPTELVLKLNDYFSIMTSIIHKHGGTLDKYIGDAVMAFWGAPLKVKDHAYRAVSAALEIQKALAEKDQFITRIGIHTSPAVVGNIGSNIRFNYTAIGDTVNLASRLEGMNKNYDTRIIISEATYLEVKDKIEARKLGNVQVKGREEAIDIYEPV